MSSNALLIGKEKLELISADPNATSGAFSTLLVECGNGNGSRKKVGIHTKFGV